MPFNSYFEAFRKFYKKYTTVLPIKKLIAHMAVTFQPKLSSKQYFKNTHNILLDV